jgi:hypothetical protein
MEDDMEVMTIHKFFDDDVDRVLWEGHEDVREIVLLESNEGALLVNKDDVIALANEFGLVVYERDSALNPGAKP